MIYNEFKIKGKFLFLAFFVGNRRCSTPMIKNETVTSSTFNVGTKRDGSEVCENTKNREKKANEKDDELSALRPPKVEIKKHLHNVVTILLCTNATPIKCYYSGLGYCCGFCPKRYLNPADLKEHTLGEHDNIAKSMFMKYSPRGCTVRVFIAKLDVTSLICVLCKEPMESLEKAIEHLQTVHNKTMHTDIKNQIVPFRFDDDKLKCVVCSSEFNSFKNMQDHMNLHYGKFPCPKCDRSYVNFVTLQSHYALHKKGYYVCGHCPKTFNSLIKVRSHERSVHLLAHKRNKCPHCGKMFDNYGKKLDHMVVEHGAERRSFKCNACESTFSRHRSLSMHVRRHHLLERKYECEHCHKTFFKKYCLTRHMRTHTGQKEYQCDICLKFYGRKSSLRTHLKSHYNDRKYRCDQCGHSFVQKCTWRNHMQSKHGILIETL